MPIAALPFVRGNFAIPIAQAETASFRPLLAIRAVAEVLYGQKDLRRSLETTTAQGAGGQPQLEQLL
jgi:hypothetical protein